MATRRAKPSWVTGKLATAERDALERLADSQFEGNVSAALRFCIRKATAVGRPATRPALAVT